MEELLKNISDALINIFMDDYKIVAFVMLGIFLLYLPLFFAALCLGDFCRLKKAMWLIINGKREEGLKKMKKQAPEYNPKLEITPPAQAFDYDKIVVYPYTYALIKRLINYVVVGTIFFVAFGIGLSYLTKADYAIIALCIIAGALMGIVLSIISIVAANISLKKAVALFEKMKDSISAQTVCVKPDYDYIINDIQAAEEVNSLYQAIRQFAQDGGEFDDLFELYQTLKVQKENPAYQDGVNQKLLSEATDIMQMLIDSYD